MAIGVSISEETATVVPDIEFIDISIAEPTVQVAVVDEVVNVSVTTDEVNVSVINDKINVAPVERAVTVVIAESSSDTVVQEEELYDIEIDTSVPNVTYVGQALPGTSAASAAWRIKRITETVTGSSVDWANGAAEFVHSWNDHLTLTYGP